MLKSVIASLLIVSIAAPVAAARIDYVLQGNFTGTLAGQTFRTPATFTGVGDTLAVVHNNLYDSVVLTSLTAIAGGVTYTVTDPTYFFANVNSTSGFGIVNQSDIIDFTAPELHAYTADSSFSATSVSLNYSSAFNTDRGQVLIAGASDLFFSASTAVPEPSSWFLFTVGFAVLGSSLRRRLVDHSLS